MSENKFRILIATDVHLGYKEGHAVRGNDSFEAFSEVLEITDKLEPDILLLGGDLFDTVNPSQTTIYKCLNLLQEHIFGDRQINYGIVDYKANFANDNLNIELPIFTIHGNHDFPSQAGSLSVCDLLHASNYVNYFGKQVNTD